MKNSIFTITGRVFLAAAVLCLDQACSHRDTKITLKQAQRRLDYGEYDRAEKAYRAILKADRPDAQKAAALFALGYIFQHKRPGEDFIKAREYYRQVTVKFPASPFASQALLAIGRCYELERGKANPDAARHTYREVRRRYPASRPGKEAELRLAFMDVKSMERSQVARGAAALARWLEKYPDHPHGAGVYLILGRIYLDLLDEPAKALRALLKADEKGIKTTSLRSDLYYRISWVAKNKTKDLRLAEKYYRKTIAEFPTDSRAYYAKQTLAEMGRPWK